MADGHPNSDSTLRDEHHYSNKVGKSFLDKTDKIHEKAEAHATQSHKDGHEKKDKQPAGGFDTTPIPSSPPGYTVRITFHRARNLPFADFYSLSSDPYLVANLKMDLPKRHKQDPDLHFRTPTIRRKTDPEWNSVWTIAHVPSSGFDMKIRIFDEDSADHDDRLGNVHVYANHFSDSWEDLKEHSYDIKKRMASKRAYFLRGCAALISRSVKMDAQLVVSVECLGKSEGEGGRAFTIGPLPWTRHYSPLIGRLIGTKERSETDDGKEKPERYNFQAIQMQLAGPVPSELYHRYVEFKPFVAGMFAPKSPKGWILNRALHHQHSRIYNYDRSTLYGFFSKPSVDMTKQFLDFVHYDRGGRIFTYVLTLDAQWRFTETGKEFGIDLLSKHTMHSDVSIYIAFSGEFFVRRLKKPWRPSTKRVSTGDDSSRDEDSKNGTNSDVPLPETESDADDEVEADSNSRDSFKDPAYYELIIDNDSGTYRPIAKYLPTLRDFMHRSLPGLKVATLDCQADSEKMEKLKQEQRDRKRKSEPTVQYLQRSSESSSISSSDEEDLDELERKNKRDKEKDTKEGNGRKVKERVEGVAAAVKTVVGGASRTDNIETQTDGGEGCDGMGGIVGEDCPVRMREKRERLKAEKSGPSPRKDGYGPQTEENSDDTTKASSAEKMQEPQPD